MILVELELVSLQDPSLLTPVAQSARPARRAYDLVRPDPRWELRQYASDVEHFGVRGVAFDGLPVYPVHVGGPPEVVGVGQAAGLTVAFGDAGSVRNPRLEEVARLEGLDADAVILCEGPEDADQTLVHDPGLEVLRSQRRRSEVTVCKELPHLRVGRYTILAPREVPHTTSDARRTRRGAAVGG